MSARLRTIEVENEKRKREWDEALAQGAHLREAAGRLKKKLVNGHVVRDRRDEGKQEKGS